MLFWYNIGDSPRRNVSGFLVLEGHMRIAFDNDLYLKLQSENIIKRVNQFGDKLYLEFGGKLFDDYHASRVLPGFLPDSKLKMLLTIKMMWKLLLLYQQRI